MKVINNGEIATIESIKGRWVKFSDSSRSMSRADAVEGREDYIDDCESLGEELDISEELDTIEELDIDEELDTIEGTEGADADEEEEATGYQGPMLRLRERLAQGAYQKAPNGQPCCGDRVAALLGALAPAQVIRACIDAMALPSNPYSHLNVGQQSMNLRNKLRGCFKREEFGFGVLVEAVEQIQDAMTAE